MSTNLNLPAMTGGQANPETTFNDGLGAVDAALTETQVVDLTNDATISAANYRACIRISVTPSGTAKTLTLQAIKRLVLITNDSTQDISVKVGTTIVTATTGEQAFFYTDGTTNGLVKVALGGATQPYDIAFFVPGVGVNSQLVFYFNADRAFTWPVSLTGSVITASVAATASTVFTINRNGSSIGTATFAASGTTATISFASAVTFAANDVITITGPATADATLANLGFTFKGTR